MRLTQVKFLPSFKQFEDCGYHFNFQPRPHQWPALSFFIIFFSQKDANLWRRKTFSSLSVFFSWPTPQLLFPFPLMIHRKRRDCLVLNFLRFPFSYIMSPSSILQNWISFGILDSLPTSMGRLTNGKKIKSLAFKHKIIHQVSLSNVDI